MVDLFGTHLRYLPVLAELAVDVAACRGERQGGGAGQKVEEGLLFDRVDVETADFSVDQRVIGPADILADAAVAPLFVAEPALPRAEAALDLPVGELIVVAGLDAGEVGFGAEHGQAGADGRKSGADDESGPSQTGDAADEPASFHATVSSTVSIDARSARPSPIFSAVAR
jgi:hypothetical protein